MSPTNQRLMWSLSRVCMHGRLITPPIRSVVPQPPVHVPCPSLKGQAGNVRESAKDNNMGTGTRYCNCWPAAPPAAEPVAGVGGGRSPGSAVTSPSALNAVTVGIGPCGAAAGIPPGTQPGTGLSPPSKRWGNGGVGAFLIVRGSVGGWGLHVLHPSPE